MLVFKSELYWEVKKTADIGETLRRSMFNIYAKYYDGAQFDEFTRDLAKKTEVIFLFDRINQELQGFSTLVEFEIESEGSLKRLVFSGDTIIEKKYWGQRTLGVAFLKLMFMKKMRRPSQPLYWFLISKGYKTYLLMANNFSSHYPRYEELTPKSMQTLIKEAADHLFPNCYQQDRGVLAFPTDNAARLKSGVADIDSNLLQHPRIRFFAEQNPNWAEGEELACIAEMKLSMPFTYYVKSMNKLMARLRGQDKRVKEAVIIAQNKEAV